MALSRARSSRSEDLTVRPAAAAPRDPRPWRDASSPEDAFDAPADVHRAHLQDSRPRIAAGEWRRRGGVLLACRRRSRTGDMRPVSFLANVEYRRRHVHASTVVARKPDRSRRRPAGWRGRFPRPARRWSCRIGERPRRFSGSRRLVPDLDHVSRRTDDTGARPLVASFAREFGLHEFQCIHSLVRSLFEHETFGSRTLPLSFHTGPEGLQLA